MPHPVVVGKILKTTGSKLEFHQMFYRTWELKLTNSIIHTFDGNEYAHNKGYERAGK